MEKVTIHDVAKRAGVSIATVSRVVNSNCRVDPDTRLRVERAIVETGYYPDAAARTMRRNKSFAIGYVVSDISNSHFPIIAKALEDVVAGESYNIIVCSSGGDREREAEHLRMLVSKKIDGLVVNSSGRNEELLSSLSASLPIVLIYRQVRDAAFAGDFVGNDDFQSARSLAHYLTGHGHRDIGLVCGPADINTGADRRDGFLAGLREAGVELPASRMYLGDYYQASGADGAKKLLRGRASSRPTALAVMNNAMAIGVLTHLRETGTPVPEAISFASFGDIGNRDLLYVQPTLVSQLPEQIGKVAAELLLCRMANRKRPPQSVRVRGQLLPGGSVRRLSGADGGGVQDTSAFA